MNLLKVIAVIILLALISSIEAQEFITFVKIEGKTCIATDKDEYEQLKALTQLVNALKEARSHGTIDSTQYMEKTASFFKIARESGIRIHN